MEGEKNDGRKRMNGLVDEHITMRDLHQYLYA